MRSEGPDNIASDSSDLKGRALTGFAWAAASFFGGKTFVFLATLFLARLLAPSEFGLVAFVIAILYVLRYVFDLGAGPALVYRADAGDSEISSTAFWVGIAGALCLIALSWAGAPYIARIGPGDEVIPLFRIVSLDLLVTALGNVHEYRLRHSLQFRKLVVPQAANGLTKAATSVVFAFAGAGASSLILGQIAGSLAQSTALWIVDPWRPQPRVSRRALDVIARFGLGMVAVHVLGQAVKNLDYMIVGARVGSVALGFYYLAFRLPNVVILPLFQVANRVLFPYYARLKDKSSTSGDEIRKGYLRTLRLASLVSFPAGCGMAALALPIVLVLYGEQWRPSGLPLALIAMWAGFAALTSMPSAVFAALGRSWLLTGAEVVQLAILAPALWVAAGSGIVAVAAAQAIVKVVAFCVLNLVACRVMRISWITTLVSILPALALSTAMAAVVFATTRFLAPPAALAIGIPAGAILYTALLRLALPQDYWNLSKPVVQLVSRRERLRRSRAETRKTSP